ncbi:MAG: hypothetical protein Q9191_005924, partial [Dirinaria sp. TL-2023a]
KLAHKPLRIAPRNVLRPILRAREVALKVAAMAKQHFPVDVGEGEAEAISEAE